QVLPHRLIGLPVGKIRQRRKRYQFTLIKTSDGSVDQILCLHHNFTGQSLKRSSGEVPEGGGRRTRQNRLNADVALSKLPVEGEAEGQDEGLGAAIHTVQQFGGDA